MLSTLFLSLAIAVPAPEFKDLDWEQAKEITNNHFKQDIAWPKHEYCPISGKNWYYIEINVFVGEYRYWFQVGVGESYREAIKDMQQRFPDGKIPYSPPIDEIPDC